MIPKLQAAFSARWKQRGGAASQKHWKKGGIRMDNCDSYGQRMMGEYTDRRCSFCVKKRTP